MHAGGSGCHNMHAGAAGLCTYQVFCMVGLERKALQRVVKLLSCVGCCAFDSGQAKVG